MRYAHISDARVEAYPKGKALCQVCGGKLYAACGEIQVWHWRHKSLGCDSWYESMSDWHITWQNRFPEEWREVVIIKAGVKHIADVYTINKKVVEFQHSPISSTEIKKREAFYQDMVWVVDARNFKDNLKIRSDVTSHLRIIRQYKASEKSQTKEELLEGIESSKTRIREYEREIEQIPDKVLSRQAKLKRYKEIALDLRTFVQDSLMESWLDRRYYNDYLINDLTKSLEKLYRPDIIEILDTKKNLELEMGETQQKLKQYNELKLLKVKNTEYKIADYDILNAKDFKKIKAIRKHSLLTPYHEIKQIQNEAEFRNLELEKDKFYFAVDLSDSISKYSKDISEIARYIEIEDSNLKKVVERIISELKGNIVVFIKSEENAISDLNDQLVFRQENLASCKLHLVEKEKNFDSNLQELLDMIDKDYESQEREIMKDNKGRYSFTWKNERRSWRSAEKPVLLDTGEDYLFLIDGEGKLRKVPVRTFLSRLIKPKQV